MKKNISSAISLSRVLAKTLRVNKHVIEKYLKNLLFGVDIEL